MRQAKISQAAYSRMADWNGPRPVASLMGEFSAGKSTLLNFMIGQEAAPTQVTATHMPPTWFVHSDSDFAIGLTWDGTEEQIDPTQPEPHLREKFVMIRRGLQSQVLASCDIIDAPGISDPGLQKDELRFLSRYTDFVVWCTSASQAWRQTERTAFGRLSKAIRSNSLLVVTRMDKLRSSADQQKVLRRVTAEAGEDFAHVRPVQTPKAAAVAPADRTADPNGRWVQSGGFGLMQAFEDTCASLSPKAASTGTAKPPRRQAPERPCGSMPNHSPHAREINRLIGKIEHRLEAEPQKMNSLRNCLPIGLDDSEPQRLLQQLERELQAFATRDRIPIDIWPDARS